VIEIGELVNTEKHMNSTITNVIQERVGQDAVASHINLNLHHDMYLMAHHMETVYMFVYFQSDVTSCARDVLIVGMEHRRYVTIRFRIPVHTTLRLRHTLTDSINNTCTQ
jgi:hypothetical protein